MLRSKVKFFIDQPVNDDIKIYENIRKIATGQGSDYKMKTIK